LIASGVIYRIMSEGSVAQSICTLYRIAVNNIRK
jgi:hypothetical protein